MSDSDDSEAGGGASRAIAVALRFTSSFQDPRTGRGRQVLLEYSLLEDQFLVRLQGDDETFVLDECRIFASRQPASVWDLFVGQQLDVLGRATTLQSCDDRTARWIAHWTGQLVGRKRKLLEHIGRYESRRVSAWLTKEPDVRRGRANVATLMLQIDSLQRQLAATRPALASGLGVPRKMQGIDYLRRWVHPEQQPSQRGQPAAAPPGRV